MGILATSAVLLLSSVASAVPYHGTGRTDTNTHNCITARQAYRDAKLQELHAYTPYIKSRAAYRKCQDVEQQTYGLDGPFSGLTDRRLDEGGNVYEAEYEGDTDTETMPIKFKWDCNKFENAYEKDHNRYVTAANNLHLARAPFLANCGAMSAERKAEKDGRTHLHFGEQQKGDSHAPAGGSDAYNNK